MRTSDTCSLINVRDDPSDPPCQVQGGAGRADDEVLRRVQGHPPIVDLSLGQVDLRFALGLEPAHADVLRDPDDDPFVEGDGEAAAAGRAVGPVAPRERLAHDRDEWRIEGVDLAEIPPGDERNPQRIEVPRGEIPQAGAVDVGRVGLARDAGHLDRPDAAAHRQRRETRVGRGGDARERTHLVEHAGVELRA